MINHTNNNMFVTIFPIVISSKEVLEESSIEQFTLPKKGSKFVRYYLGKNVDLENVIICIMAWQMDSDLNHTLFQKQPYLVRTFYNPKFEIGPEKYGIFATVVIE